MLRFLVTVVCVGGLFAAAFSQGADQQPENVKTLMRMKLEHTQVLIEGLALEDFDKITKSSTGLAVASQAAAWQVFQTPEYVRQSTEFRRTCDELTKHAKAKNLDAAVLDYLKLTTQCVECHKYVRGVKVTQHSADDEIRLARQH